MSPLVADRIALFAALAVLGVSCQAAVGVTAYPLYPKIDQGPGPAKVALLSGPIDSVDGQSVFTKGTTFELLPGCHLVVVQSAAADLPRPVFAFEMKPAHSYTVEPAAAKVDGLALAARDRSPDGTITRVPAARRKSDLEDCKRWAATQRF